MNPLIYAALRGVVQSAWGSLVAKFAVLSFLPADAVVEYIVTVVCIGGAVYLLNKMQSVTGESLWARLVRNAGKLLMLWFLGKPPVYPVKEPLDPTAKPVSVIYDNGTEKPALQ